MESHASVIFTMHSPSQAEARAGSASAAKRRGSVNFMADGEGDAKGTTMVGEDKKEVALFGARQERQPNSQTMSRKLKG